MYKNTALLVAAALSLGAVGAHADDAAAPATNAATNAAAAPAAAPVECRSDNPPWFNLCRLLPYEPTYIVHRTASHDEAAVRGDFSLRYVLWAADENGQTLAHPIRYERGPEAFVSYTGEFDYYAGTRPSSPVVNRISNPAAHLRYYLQTDALNWVDLGLEHSSDGQTVGTKSARDIARANEEYAAGNHSYFDGLSRSMNFVSAEVESGNVDSLLLRARVKRYITTDSAVTWGPLAGRDISFRDYDRLRLVLEHRFGDSLLGDVTWRAGDNGLAGDSVDLGLRFDAWKTLPLYLHAHFGPMGTLANYTESQRSIGIGLKFSD
ncbi:hypothetical protein [Derxia lacustris]|uniref:hypothetical protein n=1 Tax=Derxia lacustris TaxID=764842 RepID=UPI000A17472A|nr:hypothetical protein [Derxia lacustris]